jgi:hypothetical protein
MKVGTNSRRTMLAGAALCLALVTGIARAGFTDQSFILVSGATTTISGICAADHCITLLNGSPGLRKIRIEINDSLATVVLNQPGQTVTIDVSLAMSPGCNNTMVFTGSGSTTPANPGSTTVTISSTCP